MNSGGYLSLTLTLGWIFVLEEYVPHKVNKQKTKKLHNFCQSRFGNSKIMRTMQWMHINARKVKWWVGLSNKVKRCKPRKNYDRSTIVSNKFQSFRIRHSVMNEKGPVQVLNGFHISPTARRWIALGLYDPHQAKNAKSTIRILTWNNQR